MSPYVYVTRVNPGLKFSSPYKRMWSRGFQDQTFGVSAFRFYQLSLVHSLRFFQWLKLKISDPENPRTHLLEWCALPKGTFFC